MFLHGSSRFSGFLVVSHRFFSRFCHVSRKFLRVSRVTLKDPRCLTHSSRYLHTIPRGSSQFPSAFRGTSQVARCSPKIPRFFTIYTRLFMVPRRPLHNPQGSWRFLADFLRFFTLSLRFLQILHDFSLFFLVSHKFLAVLHRFLTIPNRLFMVPRRSLHNP